MASFRSRSFRAQSPLVEFLLVRRLTFKVTRNQNPRLFVFSLEYVMKKFALILGLVFAVSLFAQVPAKAGWWIGFPVPVPVPAPFFYGPGPGWYGPGYYGAGYYWGPYGYRYYGHPYWRGRYWGRGRWHYR
jgi:hypothetical protein